VLLSSQLQSIYRRNRFVVTANAATVSAMLAGGNKTSRRG